MITIFLPTESDMLQFAARLAHAVVIAEQTLPTTIFLYGTLGAGKTTLTRGFLRGLGYLEKVKSPTYTLVEPYDVSGLTVFHFDFYRIEDAKELQHIGIYDYFSSNAICLIEWPDKVSHLLPQADLSCYIDFKDQGRELCLKSDSARGEKILTYLRI